METRRKSIALLALAAALGSNCGSGTPQAGPTVPAMAPPRYPNFDEKEPPHHPCMADEYECLVDLIVSRLIDLKPRFPLLVGLDECSWVKRNHDHSGASLGYKWGVWWVENPLYDPRKKSRKYIPEFEPDGVLLDITLSLERPVAAMLIPQGWRIGPLYYTLSIETSDEELRKAIVRTLEEERRRFEQVYGY